MKKTAIDYMAKKLFSLDYCTKGEYCKKVYADEYSSATMCIKCIKKHYLDMAKRYGGKK